MLHKKIELEGGKIIAEETIVYIENLDAVLVTFQDVTREEKVKEQHIKDPSECKALLMESMKKQMDLGENAYEFEHRKSVILVIGVNRRGQDHVGGQAGGTAERRREKGDSGGGGRHGVFPGQKIADYGTFG